MGRKRKTAGASGGSNRGAGENADRSKAGSSEAAAHESVDSDAVSSDRGGKDGADTSRAMAAATVSTSPAGASGAGAGATVSAGPDVVPPSDVSPTVSSSLQAGLAQALRGVKKIAGFEQTAEAELTFAKAEGLLKSGATGPAAELLAQSLKMDTDKDGKVSLRFSPPLSNDVLKDMVDQAVANDASGGNVSSKSSVGIAGAAVTKTEVVIEAAPQQGKKRDASGGWKVTKTSVMSAPLKPPAPAFGTDIADIDEDRLAVAVHAAEAAIRKIPADLDWQAEKDILENKSASTDAVSKSAIVSAVNSEYDDKKKGGRRNNGSFDDEDVDGDYDEDDGDDDASDEIVEIDNEDGGANLEEVDSDGVVGVCLHCSRPRTKSKQIKTKSPNDVDVDELVEDALDLSDPMALDSSRRPRAVQVSCDDCHSFICTACHWCHEYQANHEIRVCDRCDAFYCRGCDEMDQCEDCSEVVCGGCSTLMSCKFCGCGLCEDCATACGRCGIVLCSRDAKFAVECDTCRMSYCLVCLASGTKDPCVRCGHRPSKRVEQLVHLRLKSIYKAFKQSGASLGPGKGGDQSLPPLEDDFGDGKAKGGKAAAAAALARAAGMANLPAGKGKGGKSGNDDFGPDGLAGDVGAVLQAAAAAAAAGANSNRRGGHGHGHGDGHDVDGHGGAGSGRNRYDPSFDNHAANAHPQSHRGSSIKPSESDKYAAKTEEEADAAAAALLAELDMEDGKAAASAGKKSKKKKKKERERAEKAAVAEAEAKAADDAARAMEEAEAAKAEAAANAKSKKKKTKKKKGKGGKPIQERGLVAPRKEEGVRADGDVSDASSDDDDLMMLVGGGVTQASKQTRKSGKGATAAVDSADQSKTATPAGSNQPSPKHSPDLTPNKPAGSGAINDDADDDLSLLTEFVQTRDVAAIEALMESLKGVPGKAAIRKNAKKALKKLKEELGPSYSAPSFAPPPPRKQEHEWVETNKAGSKSKGKGGKKDDSSGPTPSQSTKVGTVSAATAGIGGAEDDYRPPEPLLKLVSQTHRTVKDESGRVSDHAAPRTETVLHMSPLVVGWAIGRGGTRIRDLMEDSGAKIWIDQDSMGAKEARVVYISGPKKSVDMAVRSMKDLVAKAPVGGGGPQYPPSPAPKPATPAPAAAKSVAPAIPGGASTTAKPLTAASASAVPVLGMATPPASFAKAAAASATTTAPPPSAATAAATSTASYAATSSPAPLPLRPVSAVQTISTSTSKSGIHSHSLTCEPRFVPLLIGRRGWTVKHIQDATGARVDIDQTVSPRKIVVSGSDERAVKNAVQMVRDVLKYPHAVEGDQKEVGMPLDDALGATPVDLSSQAAIQAQAQAQAMAALLAQQQHQQQSAGQTLIPQQAAYASNALGASNHLGTNNASSTKANSIASQIPLFPHQVTRAATTGAPSYDGMNGEAEQLGRMPPQSQLERHMSESIDGVSSMQQSMGQLRLHQQHQLQHRASVSQKQQQQEFLPQSDFGRNSGSASMSAGATPQSPLGGLNSASMVAGLVDDGTRGGTDLGLMANAAPEFSANAPAFQARATSTPSSGPTSFSSSYNAALGGGVPSTGDESLPQPSTIFGTTTTLPSGLNLGSGGGLGGSSLLSGGRSVPTTQQDELGAVLASSTHGLSGATSAEDKPERDIIDDIFGAMPSSTDRGGADAMAGLGGASDWGTSTLSGWGTGTSSGSDTPGASRLHGAQQSTDASSAGLSSLIGGFIGTQEAGQQDHHEQQRLWNT